MSNKNLLERSLSSVWHPCTQMKQHETLPLVPISRGEGVWLHDFDGSRYLDAISSWWVNLFGHSNPRINAAIRDQLDRLEHVMLAGFTHEPVVQLSERLIQIVPGRLGHCFYGSDGASATEVALKMSFHYWHNMGHPGKNNFISLQNGYHGETLGALSVTDVALFRETYSPLLRHSNHVRTPDWRYADQGESPKVYALRAAAQLEDFLVRHHTKTAALILEPLIQGAAGMGMYHSDYLKHAREICDRYQVHLIADEIAVGFGRTGTLFACEQADIAPDFLCLAKGLSGGYLPLSVVMTTDSVYQAFYHDETARAFLHSHTHSGNALACRAALATLDIFEQDGVIAANRIKAQYLNRVSEPITSHPKVKNFRNCGMVWAFEVETSDPAFSGKFFQAALKQGLLLRPLENTVYFMPPYVINEQEMDMLVTGTLRALDSC
ncbi:MAG: adenosylmethionine--8-amino-7-oxononanoate transaminase [Nitrosomonadaceae bacterium]|nr:adenosylmethionine--8-amino-7-oxononanoate transaminase [Nitrosospira sp.]MDW7564813.1 adenosylmethionine--8-amino-7-oxononanoate transaminase [Nitrosomonadaceae bacterium]MBI0408903.1 adenosylmethionine--8-amino-7-oxononanoate transaminase [Nitrosospira sp.]MBI0409949.1 adenosylmethionine--8-amino-7-oxononanoate transaminase [Nitrosospira sp.]MBI0412074.1 adenosylmethionine--8-amino-7-oxononanoate transaminase [Nitrosospira sp.]